MRLICIAIWMALPIACVSASYAQTATAFSTPDEVVDKITQCLQDGLEAFMGAQGPECVVRNTGNVKATASGMPFKVADVAELCKSGPEPDQRRLSGDTIWRVMQRAAKSGRPIAPSGIRIVGALYCGELDITGVELPYSLVLDNSFFVGRVMVRNVKIRGDMSFDGSLLAGSLIIARTRIDGSFYAETGLIGRVIVSDSYFQGSWHQTESIVLGNAAFYGITLAGDAYFSGSAISMLSLNSSVIHGGLDLANTESRCGYHVRWSEIGFVFAERVGFGGLTDINNIAPDTAQKQSPTYAPWWSRRAPAPGDKPNSVGARLASPAVQPLIARVIQTIRSTAPETSPTLPGCRNLTGSKNAEFHFLNNLIRTNLCLRSFSWLERHNASSFPTTVLSLNGTKIQGYLIVDLWGERLGLPNASARPRSARQLLGIPAQTRKFEAIGVSMNALIFDFKDNNEDYLTYLDGFAFSQVHSATVTCAFQRTSEGGVTGPDFNTRGGVIEQPSLPNVQDVMGWLKKNGARSSQPFTAFVAAFERVGAGTADLRIARKTLDLCERAAWLSYAMTCPHDITAPKTEPPQRTADAAAVSKFIDDASDFASTLFQWFLYHLADHGIRPAKVLWPLTGVLIAFLGIFWFFLRLVGFEPKGKEGKEAEAMPRPVARPRALGILFMFDRLIPIYKIREEHYAVGRYFRLATGAEMGRIRPPDAPPFPMRYWWMTLWVYPANEDRKQHAENWLVGLRVIGAILAVFLLAAINALTRG